LVALASLAGCGKPATVEECEEIVERIARLKLQEKRPNDEKYILEEIDATKKALNDTTLKHCVGRRITDDAKRCMREAKTSKEIVEECFD
jgi:hypothetical protein